MKEIEILMGTYNGSKYLASQISSLQNQTYKSWTLLVHDDGSTDDTLDVIKTYSRQDSRIRLIEDGIVFHSPAQNFMHLIKQAEAPYIIFCDQDDIWLENKLEEMVAFIALHEENKPCAVYSNSYVYDTYSSTISGYATLCHPKELKDILFANSGIQGCALMFNKSLLDIVKSNIPDVVAMHDHVITLAALTFGNLWYLPKRLMLYRRHATAVTGKTSGSKRTLIIPFFQREKTVLDKRHWDAIKSFYTAYYGSIPEEKKNIFQDFFKFTGNQNRIGNAIHAYRKGYSLFQNKGILVAKILLRKMI